MDKKRFFAYIIALEYLCTINSLRVQAEEFRPIRVAAPIRGIARSDSAQTVSTTVLASEGGTVTLDDTEITIPPGALERDTEIAITRLPAVSGTGDDLTNVTTNGGGWRFEPAGTKFKKRVTIKMGYDPRLADNAAALEGLYTYFFDRDSGKWERLERVGFEKDVSRIISYATHFTDMINATISMPEGPNPVEFNVSSIKNLAAADPSSGVAKLEGLEASPNGNSSFSFSLDIPSGRVGMQPSVSLAYSSDGGSGICGKGFELVTGSAIAIDTRWGLPTYDMGRDTYLLDGVLLSVEDARADCILYAPERQVSFERIMHKKNDDRDFWTVTDKRGRVRLYGDGEGTWAGRGKASKYIWYLERESDVWGNTITYSYATDSGYVYLDEIRYTGHDDVLGLYSVKFTYEDGRPDVRIDARGKFISAMKKRLSAICVRYDEQEIRTYKLGYKTDEYLAAFGMSLLGRFSQTVGDTEMYAYSFDYEGPTANDANEYVFFGPQEEWSLAHGIQVQEGVNSGTNGSIGAGAGIGRQSVDVRGSYTSFFSSGEGESRTKETLIDINGDGLPDSVRKGKDCLVISENNGRSGFGPEYETRGTINLSGLDREESGSSSRGFSAYGGVGLKAKIPFGAGYSYAKTSQDGWSEQHTGFADINGDGFVDLVETGKDHYLKNTGGEFAPESIIGDAIPDNSAQLEEKTIAEYDDAFTRQSPLLAWRAPYAGALSVHEDITPVSGENLSEDGIVARTYIGADSFQASFAPGDSDSKTVDLSSRSVNRDQHLYLLADPGRDARNDSLKWNVTITYSAFCPYADMDRKIRYMPVSAYHELPDAGLRGIYDYTRETNQYTIKEKWEQLGSDVDEARAALLRTGNFLPGVMDKDDFTMLIDTAEKEYAGTERTRMILSLFSLYEYDGANQLYRMSGKNLIGTTCLSDVLQLVRSYPNPSQLVDFSFNGEVVTPRQVEESIFVEKAIASIVYPRSLDNPGIYDANGILAVDTIDGVKWTCDIAGKKVYRFGDDKPYADAAIDTDTDDDGNLTELVIAIPFAQNKTVPYAQVYTFTGYQRIASKLYQDEIAHIQDELQGDAFDPANARWKELSAGEYGYLRASCTPALLAQLPTIYERTPPDDAAPEDIATLPESSFTYVLKALDDAGNAALESVLSNYADEKFRTVDFPYYVKDADSAAYLLDTKVWKANITDAEIAQLATDGKIILYNGYRDLLEKCARFHLESWNACARMIRYYSDGVYSVATKDSITLLELSSEGFFYKEEPITTVYNNRDQYSTDNLVVSPETVDVLPEELGDEESDDGEGETYSVPCKEILYGGTGFWYYGIWLGNQEKDGMSFSESRLYSMRDVSVDELDENADAAQQKVIDAENSDVGSYGKPVHFANIRLNVIKQNDEENNSLEENVDDFLLEEAETGQDMQRDCLIGPISVQVKNKMIESNSGSYSVEKVDYSYCPYFFEDIFHPSRHGGNGFYEIKGICEEKAASQSGSAMKMLKIRASSSDGSDRNHTVSLSLDFQKSSGGVGNLSEKSGPSAAGKASKGTNTSKSRVLQNLIDINGDGIADIVQGSSSTISVLPGSRAGFTNRYSMSGGGWLSRNVVSSDVYGAAIGASGCANVKFKPNGSLLSVNAIGDGGGGISWAEGDTEQVAGLVDINGDGLLDYVSCGASVNSTALNTGDSFIPCDPKDAQYGKFDLNIGDVASGGTSISLATQKGKQKSLGADSTSTKTSIGIAGGVGYYVTKTETTSTLIDMNGDGLPDRVSKEAGSSLFSVYLNHGNCFSETAISVKAVAWSLPSDSKDNLTNYADGVLYCGSINGLPVIGRAVQGASFVSEGDFYNPFGANLARVTNALEMNTTANVSANGSLNGTGGVSIPIPATPLVVNLSLSVGGGINSGSSLNGVSVKVMDINGDGLADRVLRIPGTDRLCVQPNITGRIGLLTRISLPQGGSCDLEYTHTGKMDNALCAGNTPQMPQGKNALIAITMRDSGGENGIPGVTGSVHAYRTEFEYANGCYDREHKEFLGYESVTEKFADGSYRTTRYENGYSDSANAGRLYYCKGLPVRVSLYASDDTLLREREYTLCAAPFARVKRETNTVCETGGIITTSVLYDSFDGYGNLTKMIDYGASGDGDDVVINIDYGFNDDGLYLHAHPTRVTVTGSSGDRLLRSRSSRYTDKGALESFTQEYASGRYETRTLSWDAVYGNLTGITDQKGSSVGYTYDPELNQFVETISRSGPSTDRYVSSIHWNLLFGKKELETDENSNAMEYRYDAFGRLEKVISPKDSADGTPSIRYTYNIAPGEVWSAITWNKILFDPDNDDTMRTIVAVDGLGRVLLTAKQGETRNSRDEATYGWNVSGLVVYDDKARAIKEGQNFFIEGSVDDLLAIKAYDLVRETDFEYDPQDRRVRVTLPDGAEKTTDYRIASDVIRVSVTDFHKTDMNNDVPTLNYTVRELDARGNICGITRLHGTMPLSRMSYGYDPLGQMLYAVEHNVADASKDLTVLKIEYDLLGRKVAIDSVDAGRKEYEYDDCGNLVRETDNVLRGRGAAIKYRYDGLNRITLIDYPQSVDTAYAYGGADASENVRGRLTRIDDETGCTEFEYGTLGEITEESRTIERMTPDAPAETETMRYVGDYLGRMQEISFPDGEVVSYAYDSGGQVKSVSGVRVGRTFDYVNDIAYDEYGRRKYIEYGNKVRTKYTYDDNRHWLSTVKTSYSEGAIHADYQAIEYSFDVVGNVTGYANSSNAYETSQSFSYDNLHQLIRARGESAYFPGGKGSYSVMARYTQDFRFDETGNMECKTSNASVVPNQEIGADLNYNLEYAYYKGYAHRLESAGSMFYQYDGNGNLLVERFGGHSPVTGMDADVYNDGFFYYTDYGFGLATEKDKDKHAVYQRNFTWNERNQLMVSDDGKKILHYRYGADGQRALKYSTDAETMYFNPMWMVRTSKYGLRQSKHIYVGESRVVTKCNFESENDDGGSGNPGYEIDNTFWYHSDHLGSAQLVTDPSGKVHEWLEYTPYGELWIENTGENVDKLPFRFTGKEFDVETGLYYYGARYLDPKYCRWLSTDPALAEYIPASPSGDESRRKNENLPGMGGVFNAINFALYHYAGNNPVRYVDPTGCYDITSYLIPDTSTNRPGTTINSVKAIVIHWTQVPNQTPKDTIDYWATGVTAGSAHYVIGTDGSVYQSIPNTERARHGGIATGVYKDKATSLFGEGINPNAYSIGIELEPINSAGEFAESTRKSAVDLTADLCKELGLDPDTQLVRHYDLLNKNCPKYYVDNEDEWKSFINDVKAAMEE